MREYDLIVIGGGSAGLAAATAAYEAGIRNILLTRARFRARRNLMQCIHNGFGLHSFKEELLRTDYADAISGNSKNTRSRTRPARWLEYHTG
jgi:thioredoxin reductase